MDQQTPEAPAPRPPANPSMVPLAVFLVLVIAGAAGAAFVQYRAGRTRAEAASGPPAGMMQAMGGSGPQGGSGPAMPVSGVPLPNGPTTVGEGTDVVVDTALSHCATPVADMLRQLAKEHGDVLTVHLNNMGSAEAIKGVGGTCAGYVVRAKDESGELKEVARFEKSPQVAGWTEDQLKQAILDAIEKGPKAASTAEKDKPASDGNSGKAS